MSKEYLQEAQNVVQKFLRHLFKLNPDVNLKYCFIERPIRKLSGMIYISMYIKAVSIDRGTYFAEARLTQIFTEI